MTSREAFEAWFAASGWSQNETAAKLGAVTGWNAAIQHASEVAEDCIEHELGETGQAKAIVFAIKEALK